MASRCYFPFLSTRKAVKILRNKNNFINSSRKFMEGLREPSQPLGNKQAKWMSAEEAVKVVKSGKNQLITQYFHFLCS